MVVDDIVVCGAEPLFMTDYIACGRVVPERIAAIVGGIARRGRRAWPGRRQTRAPGTLGVDGYDVAGAATGVVEYADVPARIAWRPVTSSSGSPPRAWHSNGYSLVRRVIGAAGWQLDRDVPEFGRTLGEELLTPPGCMPPTSST